MDRPLKELIARLAMNGLATSTQFEPFLPQSLKNTIEGLQFLEYLGPLTQLSLESKKVIQKQELPKSKAILSDQHLINALLQLQNSNMTLRQSPRFSPCVLKPGASIV